MVKVFSLSLRLRGVFAASRDTWFLRTDGTQARGMVRETRAAALILLGLATAFAAPAQQNTGTQKAESVIGAVVATGQDGRSLSLKSDAGVVTVVTTDENTACLRIPSGEKTLAKAVPIRFADIAVGDRVLSHGTKTEKGFMAQRLIVLPATEIARKREHDLEEWKRRGIGGIVKEVSAPTGQITLELRGVGGSGRLVLNTTKAGIRRYNVASLRFEDARPSSLAEVSIGDQLRALGDKSADGTGFSAEEIVFGTFKTIGVTVTEIDQVKKEIRAQTIDKKQPVAVALNNDSVLRRISAPMAAAIAQKARASAGSPQGNAAAAAPQRPAAPPVIDVQQMIDTLPAISLSDLKVGDVLAVTGAAEKDESRLMAIKVAAGVELVLNALAPALGRPQVVRLSAGLPSVFDFSVIPIN